MTPGSRTTPADRTLALIDIRDLLVAARDEGRDLDEVISHFNIAIKRRQLREKN